MENIRINKLFDQMYQQIGTKVHPPIEGVLEGYNIDSPSNRRIDEILYESQKMAKLLSLELRKNGKEKWIGFSFSNIMFYLKTCAIMFYFVRVFLNHICFTVSSSYVVSRPSNSFFNAKIFSQIF